ncbi:MAG TPA: dienelactone hydrolase family protein [Candidatus Paceibacterota bacterium]
MSKHQIGIFIAALVILGIFIVYKNAYLKGEPVVVKNADTLVSEKNLLITTGEVTYFEEAKGYLARPEAEGKYPGVVMVHENRGLRPETKMAAEQLAKEGYMVLAVDLLGGTAEDQEGAHALTAKFDQEKGVANMRAAAAYLRKEGAKKIASLGWCFGGKQSVELAISGEQLDATVVYYGGNMATTTDKLVPIKWPVLGIFGDKDQVIPVETIRTFEESLEKLGVENEIYIYPGVGHAFANPSGMNYAPKETKDAWEKTLVFLEKNLK